MWRRSSWTTNFSFKGFFSVYLKTFHFILVADTVTLSLYYFTERLNSSRKTTANTINPNKYFIFIHHICAQFKRSIYIVFGVWISVKQWKRQKERERKKIDVCVYFTKIIKLHTHTEYFNTCAVNDCELHVRYTNTPSHIKCGRPQVESESMNNVFWRSHSPELFSLFCIRLIKTTKQKKAREINTINRKH